MRKSESLSRYLFGKILFYSLLLSLLSSLVNGWISYQDSIQRSQEQVESVLSAYRATLSKSIWEVDYEAAKSHLRGLDHFPAVLSARVTSAGPLIEYTKHDADLQQKSPVLTYPLLSQDGQRDLGRLEIRLDQHALNFAVWRDTLRFTLIVAFELFLLAVLIFFLFRRHVSSPIQALSEHVQSMSEARLSEPAPMPTQHMRNELHQLAEGFTRLQSDLLAQFSARDASAKELEAHRDQLNQLLQQQEHQLDMVLHHMADGGAVLDGKGQIQFANPAWARMMNRQNPQNLIGSWPTQWLNSPRWSELIAQLSELDTLTGESILLNRIEAAPVPVEASISVLERDTQGAVQRVQIMVRDLTSRIESERVLIEAKESALQASLAKSAFLANMSHEIRTPLNAVLGFATLLADTSLDELQGQYIQSIRTSGTALLMLLNDLLDFSKIEAGQLQLEQIDYDLRRLLEDTQDIVCAQAQDKGLDLVCLVDASVPLNLVGDPSRLRQVLINLLNNALKFTPQGEIVTRARLVANDGQKIRIRVEVQDNGIGISAEAQRALFQPFHQADASTTRRFGGTGLGLSICRRLVEAMNGQIGVESELGHGATFWFEIEQTLGEQKTPVAAHAELAGKLVFVLSPSASNRQKLAEDLRLMKCEARCVASETELIDLLAAEQTAADLVMVDLPVAVEINLRLPATLHATPRYETTPLILAVTQGALGQGALAEQAGYAAYLSKPIHFDDLQKCLVQLLDQSKPAEQKTLLTRHRIAEIDAQSRHAVLLVEDNLMNQKVAALLLEKLGVRVDVANNGVEAVTAVQNHSYDLILMDCQMPVLDGYGATRQIRALPEQQGGMPIVALTANAFAEDKEQCFDAGMNDYMTKPIQIDTLKAMLAKWLPVMA